MVVKSDRVKRGPKMLKFKKKHKLKPAPKVKEEPKSELNLDMSEIEAKIHLLTQDLKLAQALAGNEKKVRDKFLKNLKKWLNTRSNSSYPFSDQDFMRLWKGLFYCMWMSDKPLIQEQLCEDMGSLFYSFDKPEIAIQFYGRFLETMTKEWIGIDHWRLDKFMMLMRRITRHILYVLKNNEWSAELLKALRKQLSMTVLNDTVLSFGCTMHFIGLFIEEVAKVSEGTSKKSVVTQLLKPFITFLATTTDFRLTRRIIADVFYALLKQSDLGKQYEEKYEVWKNFGFPSERIDDLELVEESNDEEEEQEDIQEDGEQEKTALDPRAGNVNVVLAELPFNANKIVEILEKALYDANTRSKNRKAIKKIIANYQTYANGEYPLGVKKMNLPQSEQAKMPQLDDKIEELDKLEEDLLEESRLFKTLSKSQKKKYYKIGGSVKDFVKSLNNSRYSNVDEEDFVQQLKKEKLTEKKRKLAEMDQSEAKESKKKKKKRKHESDSMNSSQDISNGIEVEENNDQDMNGTTSSTGVFSIEKVDDEWDKPLEEGEIEYFVTPTKQRLKQLNSKQKLVKNPFAALSPKSQKKQLKKAKSTPATPQNGTPSSAKRVKIVLARNMAQDNSEYLRQIRNSPQIPFDSTKKPAKGLLKPNLLPSPINPYYKKKIGLKLHTDR